MRSVVLALLGLTSDAKPLLCMTCDHAFEGDLPTVVIAGVLERFRANGNPDAREFEAGSA